ncbi:MAG: hydrogenase maturation protease [Gemmatimonadaceae bacterium]|nr:hydrogenase maturation protease [Gemmatimonadaceae bacterium]
MTSAQIELTAHGYLVLTSQVARAFFPNDTLLAMPRGQELWLLPTRGPGGGGLMLKQRNLQGDRSVLVREALNDRYPVGQLPAFWDDQAGALRVAMVTERAHGAL